MKRLLLSFGLLCALLFGGYVQGQDSLCALKKSRIRMEENDTLVLAIVELLDTNKVGHNLIRFRGGFDLRITPLGRDSLRLIGKPDWFGFYPLTIQWSRGKDQSFQHCTDTLVVEVRRIEDKRYRQLGTERLNAWFKNTGSFFNDKYYAGLTVGDSNISLISDGGLWIGGLDEAQKVHATYQTYDRGEIESELFHGYRPGLYGIDTALKEEELWKLKRYDAMSKVRGTGASSDFNSWPYQNIKFNSFLDLDSNEVRSQRDIPCILGEEMVYGNFTDMFNESQSPDEKVGVNVRLKAFAPGKESPVAGAIILRYYIENVSLHDYDSLFVGLFTEFALDYPYNDFNGCDTLLDAFFGYNGEDANPDRGEKEAPAVGLTFLNHKMYAYTSYFSSFTRMGLPNDEEYYYYLKGRLKDNKELFYGGAGADHWGLNRRTRYSSPGNVTDTLRPNWTDYTGTKVPGNRRGVGSVGPFYLKKGATIQVDVAVVSGLKEGNGHLENVALLKENIKEVRSFYETHTFECYNPEDLLVKEKGQIYAFPNPFTNYINVYVPKAGAYEIFNITGTSLKVGKLKEGINFIRLNENLPKGIYLLSVDDGVQQKHFKLQTRPF